MKTKILTDFQICIKVPLTVGFRNPVVSWMEIFVTKVRGFRLVVIVTKDLVLNVAVVLYPLLFTHIC